MIPGSAGVSPASAAIVFTLEREAAPFRRINPGAKIIVSGIGRTKARFAAQIAVEGFRPKLVIAAGFCGALAPHLAVGDIVASPRIVTVNELIATPDAKRQLAARTGADKRAAPVARAEARR